MKYLLLLLLPACAPPNTADAAKAAECSGIRRFFDEAQSALISKGACDNAPSVSACVPHVALREAFIASLQENHCPSESK